MEIDSDSILSRVPPPGAVPVSLSEGIGSKMCLSCDSVFLIGIKICRTGLIITTG